MASIYQRTLLCAYYLIKFYRRNKRISSNEKHCGEKQLKCKEVQNNINLFQCRVCLRDGNIPICDKSGKSDILTAINTFGDLDVSVDDGLPQYLCTVCYNQLQGAILFRKTAQQSNNTLRDQIKRERTPVDDIDNSIYDDLGPVLKKTCKIKKTVKKKQLVCEDDDILLKYYNKFESDSKIKRIQCRICSKVISQSHHRDHFALHNRNVTRFVCHICGKPFLQRAAYLNHRFIHYTDYTYKCRHCPYKGKSPSLLKLHMRTHTRNYTYMCTECPARFLTKSNLNKHMLKHKEPMYKCDDCRRAFHTELSLRRHYDVEHLGIKNQVCTICNKAFGFRKALMQHERDVHKREKLSHGRMPGYLQAQQVS